MKLTFRSADGTEHATEVAGDRIVIGREESSDVVLEDEEVSREHAVIETQSDGRTLISDLGSRNGTYVNGRRIAGPTELRGNESIRLGGTELRISGLRSQGETIVSPPDQSTTRPAARLTNRTTLAAAVGVLVVLAVVGGILLATDVIGGGGGTAATNPQEPEDENPIPEIIRETRPAIANIITHAPPPVGRAGGSGWVLDANEGFVVTASHVVETASRFTVEVANRRKRAELFAAAPCEDLAILRLLDPEGLKEMRLGSQSNLEQGEDAIALGFPRNKSLQDTLVATTGIVSQVKTTWREQTGPEWPIYKNMVQTDAAINAGSSGGPLVNANGELIGVNVAFGGGQNENYAIGIDRVKQITDQLVEGRSLGWSGMNFAFGIRGFPGMLNLGAVPRTPADFEGLDEDALHLDYATHVNGKRTRTIRQYCNAVGRSTSGDSARYRFVDAITGDAIRVQMAFE